MTNFLEKFQNNRTLAGILLELWDVYGNKLAMIIPTKMVNHNKDCKKYDLLKKIILRHPYILMHSTYNS